MKTTSAKVLGSTALLSALFVVSLQSQACGLELAPKGGFANSHPGSLAVAVAVADARSAGRLPAADSPDLPNELRLHRMLTDLQRLQARLNAAGATGGSPDPAGFSLVLVGPGLWSRFVGIPGGVAAEYHVAGPLDSGPVVLTHHAVLQAMLDGELAADEAAAVGLLAFVGEGAESVRKVFELGLDSSA
jgi:hypothetical protein